MKKGPIAQTAAPDPARDHPGMVGDIISEQWAELSRNGGRLHSEIVGDIDQNPQAVRGDVDCRPSLALGHPCCPDLPRHPPGPRGRTGQRAMVNHVFVTDHPQPLPRVSHFRS